MALSAAAASWSPSTPPASTAPALPEELLLKLHQKRPLELKPFLPPDNHEIGSPAWAWVVSSAKPPPPLPPSPQPFSTITSQDHANHELEWLLKLRFPRFAAHMLYDPQLRVFLDTFLRYRKRPYDPALSISTPESLKSLSRRVFFAYSRLVNGEHAKFASNGGDVKATSVAWGALLNSSGVVSMPKLLDLAALYGYSNIGPLTQLITTTMEVTN